MQRRRGGNGAAAALAGARVCSDMGVMRRIASRWATARGRPVGAVLLALLPALLALGACAPGRLGEARMILEDVAAGPGPSRLKTATPAPERRPLSFAVEGRRYDADLYRPGAGRPEAVLLLVPGLAPAGRDDPRLVAFASTLARARFAVLVPDLPSFRALRVSAANIRQVADALTFLGRAHGPRPEPTGVIAISYAVGPALLAARAADPGTRADFFVGIGGYYDIEAAITFFTTGHYRETPGGPWRYRPPNAYGKWLFVESNAGRIADRGDRAALIAMARRRRADPAAEVADLAVGLGAEARAVYRLVTNRDPERVPALIDALPAGLRADLRALDLEGRDLRRAPTRVVLLHGRDDPIVPASESARLAAALPEGRARLYLVDNLFHAELGPGGWRDALTLWRAAYALLALRDAGQAGSVRARASVARGKREAGVRPAPRPGARRRARE